MTHINRWPNDEFPCHQQHRAEDAILDPLHDGRQFSARCPACGMSYRLAPTTFSANGQALPVVVWTLVMPTGETVTLPPVVDGLFDSDAPLFADPPWSSRWPQDSRRPADVAWSLPRVTVDEVNRDGYAATTERLAIDADWGLGQGTSLIQVVDPVTVAGKTVVEPGEVIIAQRGVVRLRPNDVVLASARSVNYGVIISRGFCYVARPLDIDFSPPWGRQHHLFETASQ